ncbi:DEHA2C08602p [Debaryomyces hansenii CBS767]|uniref:DEHA2C08602p n=1 Tax=Debaryomyces hansenii (strain ATCC 36239 / CBS 767 / BCRC 21394 / JCM 1990 / NBRC 0083 / IGC 2968) TaxID=284592 RepID=Q6BUR7_DEBHA|nr:DEHA2C08602p [Debaryomyces hansenii CBS767]CAG86119.2 DEHA2C08602p [Debaryomyces hansenii CBS767]|eukprot:XP_458052.2 DEHA2C08602p [Debaryomyces hansenii CBS767]
MSSGAILVTGGTGFVGTYCVIQSLEQGYGVHTSVRDLKKEAKLREVIKANSNLDDETINKKLKVFEADVTRDEGWAEAFQGVDHVLHVASPFPLTEPEDPNDLIIPAKEGTLRILRFATSFPSVNRVVLTSSFAAVGYGHAERSKPFDENDFTNLDGTNVTYVKSKTVAEIEAWKFVKSDANTHAQSPIALTVLNPAYIFGPPLKKSPDNSSSLKIIDSLLNGAFADGCKNMYLSAIDVRDVANIHVQALQTPESEGNRFILNTGENVSLLEVANILAENLPAEYTKNLPTKELEGTKDTKKPSTNEKAKRVFNWEPIPFKDALLASAKGLLNI